jgi:hypothetical protein
VSLGLKAYGIAARVDAQLRHGNSLAERSQSALIGPGQLSDAGWTVLFACGPGTMTADTIRAVPFENGRERTEEG